ncbi:hypothetical protein B0H13DRAFT_1851585 [Mycena leptocephala]|nr:hypothetical protein B0H13DRAFT_1851585 [Mycena leptocephala]
MTFLQARQALQLISDLSQGIRGLGVDPGQTNRRLITYSKRTRHNRRLGNTDSNQQFRLRCIQQFFQHSADHAQLAGFGVKRTARVPTLASMCLLVLGKGLSGGLGEYSDEDIEKIYECLPAHHRVKFSYGTRNELPHYVDRLLNFLVHWNLASVVTNPVGGSTDTVARTPSKIENRRRDTVHGGGKYQTKCLKHLLTRVAFYVENAKEPQGLVLPQICGPDMDASCDELDLFHYRT